LKILYFIGTFGDVFKVNVVFKKTGDIDEDERLLLSREEFLRKAIDDPTAKGVVVAVKVLKRLDAIRLRQSLQEAQVWAELSHPSIVNLYHVEINFGKLFLYTEFIDGSDIQMIMADKIQSTKGNSLQNLIIGSYQIVAGMKHAHDNFVHHFDIKPANIMVRHWSDPKIEFKIMDWGIAQSGGYRDSSGRMKPKVDEKNVCAGSPFFMAPEYRDIESGCTLCTTRNAHSTNPCCASVDNWSLAATLLNIWQGNLNLYYSLYKGEEYTIQSFQSALDTFKSDNYPNIPEDIIVILYVLLHPQIEKRFCSLQSTLDAIKRSAIKSKVDIASLEKSMASKTSQVEKLVLEGLSMLELSYSLVDQITMSETLESAKSTFLEITKSDQSAAQDPYHREIVDTAHLSLATIYFLLARIELENDPSVILSSSELDILSESSFTSLYESVSHYSSYLVRSKKIEDESNESYYNFLVALKYLGVSKYLSKKEFIQAKALYDKLIKAVVFSDKFEYKISLNEHALHLGATVQMKKDHPNACLVNLEVGSIVKASASRDRFKIATPRFDSCWIPASYLAASPTQPVKLKINDVIFRREQKSPGEVCGLQGGETGIVLEVNEKRPTQPYRVRNPRNKQYWCSPSAVSLASHPSMAIEL